MAVTKFFISSIIYKQKICLTNILTRKRLIQVYNGNAFYLYM